jgi:hypothetical protein
VALFLTGGLDNVELRRGTTRINTPAREKFPGAVMNAKYVGSKFDHPALRI